MKSGAGCYQHETQFLESQSVLHCFCASQQENCRQYLWTVTLLTRQSEYGTDEVARLMHGIFAQ